MIKTFRTSGNLFMDSIALNLLFLLSRYLHIVATTILVGGVLFHELIVPVAIADLKEEQKLAVFARRGGRFAGSFISARLSC